MAKSVYLYLPAKQILTGVSVNGLIVHIRFNKTPFLPRCQFRLISFVLLVPDLGHEIAQELHGLFEFGKLTEPVHREQRGGQKWRNPQISGEFFSAKFKFKLFEIRANSN